MGSKLLFRSRYRIHGLNMRKKVDIVLGIVVKLVCFVAAHS